MGTFTVRTLTAVWLALLLTACGGFYAVTLELVSYEGTTLIVNGVRYERPPYIYECGIRVCDTRMVPQYRDGLIVIDMDKADEKAVVAIINTYGISLIARSGLPAIAGLPASVTFVVEVPALFADQWTAALRNEPLVKSAGTYGISQPT